MLWAMGRDLRGGWFLNGYGPYMLTLLDRLNALLAGWEMIPRKSERLVEKQSLPTPSRRPEKGKNQSSSSSSGSTKCGTSGAPVHKMSQVMPSSSGPLNTTDANHVSNFSHLTSKLSQVLKADMVGYDGGRNLHDDSEKSLHLFLKPEIAKLCEILQLPENVKVMVEQFREYVLNNHHVSREPPSLLQAFLISLVRTFFFLYFPAV
ncbi:hypothetical protein POTOM_020320 [Populus tomentosa]|uniref:MOM1 alpha-helical domain-containing protein n=1 Tax=Populus tomentosa TaxID=118781 RepID=A0A8X7ZPX3_POPTO|nr:hypothetical protein POTOM_020320 [Populus tomentosa]